MEKEKEAKEEEEKKKEKVKEKETKEKAEEEEKKEAEKKVGFFILMKTCIILSLAAPHPRDCRWNVRYADGSSVVFEEG